MKKRLLVTGGAGFIGSNFVNHMIRCHPDVSIVVWDKLTYAGNKRSLPRSFFDGSNKNHRFVEACVTDREKISEAIIEADTVVHFASESHVTRSLAQADDFVHTNIFGTMVICEEIIKYPVEKFILISSSEVYGTAVEKPMREEHTLNPASPYAGSKAGQDRMAYSFFCSFGIPLIILRPFNQYGPQQHTEKVIPKFITRLLQEQKIYLENNGDQTRDWLYVEDLCRAIEAVIEMGDSGLFGEIINIGSGCETTVRSIAMQIADLLDIDPDQYFEFGKDRKGQVMSHIGSIEKAYRLLNWKPEHAVEKGLKKTVDWYRENPDWWRNLKRPVLKITELGV